ncbi:galactosylceramide sulfotransferase-like [Ornithodoros turicata]|uniref:galactosylceramide sulfotransferase-like n=1 Tax=Ornithodoros turicata TaxID=34597 RepID=UPI003139409C
MRATQFCCQVMYRYAHILWFICTVVGLFSVIRLALYKGGIFSSVSTFGGDSTHYIDGGASVVPVLCQSKKNIVFLKTHKCASSTIMNIFLRYGITHNLTFVLPAIDRTNYIGHPEYFSRNLIKDMRPYNYTHNILTHHTRFNKTAIAEVMPKDTVYVTILRRPEDMFDSLYHYYAMSSMLGKSLAKFVEDETSIRYMANRKGKKFGFNQMCFDLGADRQNVTNTTGEFIDFLEHTFNLIMIAERLDESLVLLKDLLCWTVEDVVVFKLNARQSKYKETISSKAKEKLRECNSADASIYDHFLQVLDRKVATFGTERMAQEVDQLRRLRESYSNRCINTTVPVRGNCVLAFQRKDQSELCRYMTLSELEFHALIVRRQNQMIQKQG